MTEATRVLAPNPGPMTLDGTNTWVLRGGGPSRPSGSRPSGGRPRGARHSGRGRSGSGRSGSGCSGSGRSVVVDPGPLDGGHLAAVRAAAGDVALVLVTHRHRDHTDAAAVFAASMGCGVRAHDAAFRVGDDGLDDGDVVTVDALELEVLATPGHTSDSVCLLARDDGSLLTGDTVLGRGTSVVAHPDGQLGPYLRSLQRLLDLATRGIVTRLLPGHGPVVDDAETVLEDYLAHRRDRLEQVRRAVASGATTPRAVVESVYADVDRSLWPAAELSVSAQLDHLRAGG